MRGSNISIIILTSGVRDRIFLIEKIIESIAKQSIKPNEVIIATEINGESIKDIASKYLSSFRVLETSYWNKCLTGNKAILESRGDIVFLLEDDLYLAPNFFEEILRTFEKFPDVGCVYGNVIWVFREGLKSRGGLLGLVSKVVSKLSVHESLFPKLYRRINEDVFEVPVFTMSVACRRKVLISAGLYDMSVSEPILGEDYDLALRIRGAGYRILKNNKAVAYHFTKQVSKGVLRYRRDPRSLRGVYGSEVYFISKNMRSIGVSYVISHTIYRILESVAWSIRSGNPLALLYGVSGSLIGFLRGLIQKS